MGHMAWRFPVCNGMICLAKRDGSVMLWNPTIQKLLALPKSKLGPLYDDDDSQQLGFWFDSSTQDYKVVRMIIFFTRAKTFQVEIYSLNGNCWRIISYIPYNYEIDGDLLPVLNGNLHWIGFTNIQPVVGHSICGFDVNTEVFRKIELTNVLSDSDLHFALAIYKHTFIAVMSHCYKGIGEEVWVMKEYNNVESWTKIWQFDESQHPLLQALPSPNYRLNVIWLLNNGVFLCEELLKTRMDEDDHVIYLTNLERKENENLEVLPEPFFKFGIRLKYFEESLVLLDNANATTL